MTSLRGNLFDAVGHKSWTRQKMKTVMDGGSMESTHTKHDNRKAMIKKDSMMKPKISIDQRVKVMNMAGTVAYIGPTYFAAGEWVGVILDKPRGNTSRRIKGISYFCCQENYGMFIKRPMFKIINEETNSSELMKPMVK